tara:strand:+ start:166 stop:354 length:189 start_codon:yes stop_codon:yes gene_type:complete
MPVIRATTCELCGVDVEIWQIKGQYDGKVREHVMSVRGHPKDLNNNYALYCAPNGPAHKEVK